MEVDSDSESDFTPEPEQEEPEQEEVTAADDLSMLDQLQKGLPHVDATEPDEHVIHDDTRDSDDDDDDDPGAYIDDPDYYQFVCIPIEIIYILLFMSGIQFFYVVLISFTLCHGRC